MRLRNRIVWTLGIAFAAALVLVTAGTLHLCETPGERLRLVLLSSVAILLNLIVVFILASRVADRPIRMLSAGIAKLSEGEFGFRFEVERNDDLATLLGSFNGMAEKLERTVSELRETRDYFEGIVENSADLIITVNPRGYVYTFNRGAEQILGYSRGEMIGRNVERLFADPAEREAAVEALRHADDVVNYETHLKTKDGRVRDVMLTLSRLKDPDGNAIGTFGIAKDLTESNRMRKRLLHAERFAAIGEAIAGIQHALKNMMNALKGGSYMVKIGIKNDDRPLLEEGWDMVQGGIANITKMSMHMLNYVKEWKPELVLVDVAGMIEEIEKMFRPTAEGKGVALRVDVPADSPQVRCDARLVHTAVIDILSNALDACMEKPYEEDETPEIAITAAAANGGRDFVLAVKDNGCGMTKDVQENVFTPFFSTKSSWGTGLGLALTARTIRLHGGEIEVESSSNVGTEFRIIVPVDGPDSLKEETDGPEGAGG